MLPEISSPLNNYHTIDQKFWIAISQFQVYRASPSLGYRVMQLNYIQKQLVRLC